MQIVSLKVENRDNSLKAAQVREQGLIPGECYGSGKDNASIQMEYQSFRKAYIQAGDNTIIELDIAGTKHPVLVHDVQFDPIHDTVTHVDFKFVDMKVEVVANIPVHLVGESPAVKNMGGTLVQNLHELEVKCLPSDLPHEFEVDVTVLEDFHSAIHVSDVAISDKVEILNSLEQTIATVAAPRAEEEPEDVPGELVEPEVIGEKKEEESSEE